MFSKIVFLFILIVLAIAQVTILPQFFPAGAIPNLILIAVIYWTIRSGFNDAWKKAVLAGFILDLAYGWAIGINILALSVVSFMVGYFTKRFSAGQKGWGFMLAVGLVGIGTVVNNTATIALIKTVGWLRSLPLENSMIYPLGMNIIWSALLASVCFMFLYLPLEKLEKFFDSYNSNKFVKTRFLK